MVDYFQNVNGTLTLTAQEKLWDNGQTSREDFDLAGNVSTPTIQIVKDALGRDDYRLETWANGKQIKTDWDQENANPWKVVTFYYKNGLEDNRVTEYDSGQKFNEDFDETGTNVWQNIVTSFDSLGNVQFIETRNDNGAKYNTQFDYANSNDWGAIETIWTASGAIDFQSTSFDNGFTQKKDWDTLGQSSWATQSITYDSIGRVTNQYLSFDDSSYKSYAYDPQNTSDWLVLYNSYNAAHEALDAVIHGGAIYDNGSQYEWSGTSSNGLWSDLSTSSIYITGASFGFGVSGFDAI